jgi:hypothetical protein
MGFTQFPFHEIYIKLKKNLDHLRTGEVVWQSKSGKEKTSF